MNESMDKILASLENKDNNSGKPVLNEARKLKSFWANAVSFKIAWGIIIFVLLSSVSAIYYFSRVDTETLVSVPVISPSASPDISLDSDNDGLPDRIEKVLGTDSIKVDSDGDTYSDLSEIKSGYDPLYAGTAGKYSPEEWQAVKDKIKAADAGFYDREFGTLSVASQSPSSTPVVYGAMSLSEDKKNIIADGNILLSIDNDAIFDFFRTKSDICSESNIKLMPDNKAFCENKEIFKSKTKFTSIVSSSDKTKAGFAIESDILIPDNVVGIFYPYRTLNKVSFLTSYYLGNEFIGFSPTGVNFVYKGSCWEGYCGLYIKNVETLANKIDLNNSKGGVDAREADIDFIKWISDNEIEYKIGAEQKKVSF